MKRFGAKDHGIAVGEHHEGSGAVYMAHKVSKLREQYDEEQHALRRGDNGPGTFDGVAVYFDGYVEPSAQELRDLLFKNGGKAENYFTSAVTHVVCSNLPDAKLKELRRRKKVNGRPFIVRPEWIINSAAMRVLLPPGRFPVAGVNLQGTTMMTYWGLAAEGSGGPGSVGKDGGSPAATPATGGAATSGIGGGDGGSGDGGGGRDEADGGGDGNGANKKRPACGDQVGNDSATSKRLRRNATPPPPRPPENELPPMDVIPVSGAPLAAASPASTAVELKTHSKACLIPGTDKKQANGSLDDAFPLDTLVSSPVTDTAFGAASETAGQLEVPAAPQPAVCVPSSSVGDCAAGHDKKDVGNGDIVDSGGGGGYDGGNGEARTTHDDPRFLETFFENSRLHFIGSWKGGYDRKAAMFRAERDAVLRAGGGVGGNGVTASVGGRFEAGAGANGGSVFDGSGCGSCGGGGGGDAGDSGGDGGSGGAGSDTASDYDGIGGKESVTGAWSTEAGAFAAEPSAREEECAQRERMLARLTGTLGRGQMRVILHVDMDCFFVSVLLRHRPELRDKPVAVAHSTGERAATSEVSSCNYPARCFGVCAGMFMGEARRRCPNLTVLRYDFKAYEEVSDAVYRIFFRNAPVVMAVSCDEAFLELPAGMDAMQAAADIRHQIFVQTGCSASAGGSCNMLLARMATKAAKPDGQRWLPPADALAHLGPLPLTDLPGVGWRTARQLEEKELETGADLWTMGEGKLRQLMGQRLGEMLWKLSRGIDDRPVQPRMGRKSVGVDCNYGVRFKAEAEAVVFAEKLATEVAQRLEEGGLVGRAFTFKLKQRSKARLHEQRFGAGPPTKYLGCGICDQYSKSAALSPATAAAAPIGAIAARLLKEILRAHHCPPSEIRGMGIQVTKLSQVGGDGDDGGAGGSGAGTMLAWLRRGSGVARRGGGAGGGDGCGCGDSGDSGGDSFGAGGVAAGSVAGGEAGGATEESCAMEVVVTDTEEDGEEDDGGDDDELSAAPDASADESKAEESFPAGGD
ncbi:unnamed protein product, partial [Phaeothamnion confervicola]